MAAIRQVAADPGSLTADGAALKALLEAMGHTVTPFDDNTAVGDLSAVDLVVWGPSATINAANYKSVTKPLLCLSATPGAAMEFGSSVTGANATTWYISDHTHVIPAAAGVGANGDITIYTASAQRQHYTNAGPGVANFARNTDGGGAVRYGACTYETGATMMNSFAAPARRCFIGLGAISLLTTIGQDILEEAVNWTGNFSTGLDYEIGLMSTIGIAVGGDITIANESARRRQQGRGLRLGIGL
jgi:hypothetical protein